MGFRISLGVGDIPGETVFVKFFFAFASHEILASLYGENDLDVYLSVRVSHGGKSWTFELETTSWKFLGTWKAPGERHVYSWTHDKIHKLRRSGMRT